MDGKIVQGCLMSLWEIFICKSNYFYISETQVCDKLNTVFLSTAFVY